MKTLIVILLLITPCLFADINGDISIGKYEDIGKAKIKIGYDFTWGEFCLIPYFEYINYFTNDGFKNYPFRDIFGSGVRLNWRELYLNIHYECRHEVSSLNSRETPLLYGDALPNSSSRFITLGYRWGKNFD
jgi:hypothetical protein